MQTIYILTPCMNAVDTIDRTIMSVVTQAGDFKIRYHIQDAGSTDGTYERVLWWKARLESSDFPIQCKGIEFSSISESDTGMYDGLIKGFKHMPIRSDDFMTWINADDVLMTGALALVSQVATQFQKNEISWFGGGCAIIRDDHLTVSFDRKVPTEAIKLGLCDGVHWDFLQQEGTFFRKWLWDAVSPEKSIGELKLAGDWNLWRLFAHKASFVQFGPALGGFRRREGQLSALQRENYMGEIESFVSREERRQHLKKLGARGKLVRRRLVANSQGRPLVILEENVDRQLASRYQAVFSQSMPTPLKDTPDRTLCEGKRARLIEPKDGAGLITRSKNIYAYDHEWQYPAVTEQHAFHRLRDSGGVPSGMAYVAYPWATLIDKIQSKAKDLNAYVDTFRQFCYGLPKHLPKVTVCQHILMRNYLHLFEEAGIEDIFWAHATHEDVAEQATAKIRIHPFPLYPVQVTEALPEGANPRPYLFSFIGARSNQWYLTDVRSWIIDELQSDPRGQIVGRDAWHYNKIVYDHQILTHRRRSDDSLPLVDQSASDEFRKSLTESIFSLCPSGSGPNSIRLWESIGAGSIPVILSDHYAPPGDPKLWEAAVVFCEETPEAVRALPERLAAIASDPEQLSAMRHALRQLWLLYGPQSFVYDIQSLIRERVSLTPVEDVPEADAGLSVTARFIHDIARRDPLSEADAILLLRACANELLTDSEAFKRMAGDAILGPAVQQAQVKLTPKHEVVRHFNRVLEHSQQVSAAEVPSAPAISKGAVPAIYLIGRHGDRTPLSYAPFRKVIGEQLRFVDDPAKADLIVSGFNIDIGENAATIASAIGANAGVKVAIISEEPLWDTLWSNGFTERDRVYKGNDLEVSYRFLNHQNSSIFHFKHIPYFLLTNDSFLLRYATLMQAYAGLSAAELLRRWQAAAVDAAFFAEVRDTPNYIKNFPELDIYGLSVFRTEIARTVTKGNVLRIGAGWRPQARRQELPDWHLDKLAQLSHRSRVISAYENTHHRNYISEKIFDAFAAGGIPTYHASDDHRIFEIIPKAVIINSFGLSASEASKRIETFTPDICFAEAYLETLVNLQRKFSNHVIAAAEKQRIVRDILDEIRRYI